ncbi:MAG: hypothetical protein FWF29_05820, partial [Treponema sp.]|nr:hypothetical protein [Treponema sp.]
MKKHVNMIAGTLAALAMLIIISCTQPESGGTDNVSATPAAAVTSVAKTATTQKDVVFVLTSTNIGMWKAYSAQTGGSALLTVTVKFMAPNLTLSSTGSDLAAATYYVSVTENGKTESARLALTVEPFTVMEKSDTPTADVTSASKTSATQKAVAFTLTSTNTGTWKVYDTQSGDSALTDVTASFTAPTLTITSGSADLAAATYYVSVTEAGKTESARLALIVIAAGQSQIPAFAAASFTKTEFDQSSATFTLSEAHPGAVWAVYANEADTSVHPDATVSASGTTLTITAKTGALAVGTYYVTVMDSGDILPSPKAAVTVEPAAPGVSVTVSFGQLPS